MEDRLTRALSTWASGNRVDGPERQRIRTEVLLTPQVDALWWDQFNQQMTRIAARAGRPRAGEPGAVLGGWAGPTA